ncbi:MFS transporter [Francisella sp. LA112445]|uniref:MFS transporter n=1 Tax=Francisella sp. LA112445 TaxID=1395624 RepID=UPI001788DF14|nr:MFS transporter [Francisella sp. LA112445]QIW09888.1 MHS family MFS transporter [Francisella sp. LA112445]
MLNQIKTTLKNSFGNIIEWYDFSLYGYFATIISVQFFPHQDAFVALIATFGAFAAGFIARPVGSIFFGRLGDRLGRYYSMNIAIIMMAVPTVIMAFLPGYKTIGIWAPILLVIVRVVQGLSAGGQFGNLMTITSEDDDQTHRGFSLAMAYSTSVVGFLIASFVSFLSINLLPQEWQYYSWRVPFALGFILLLLYLFFRENDKIQEEIKVEQNTSLEIKPMEQLFKHYKWRLSLIVVLSTTAMILYYLDVTYMVTYMERELNLSLSSALAINTLSIVAMCIVMPFFGYLSDIYGRKRTHIIGYFLLIIFAIPMVMFMQLQSIVLVAVMVISMAMLTAIIQGVSTPYYTEIFPPRVRATGCSIGFGLGASLSGFAPMLATVVMEYTSATFGLCLLLVVVGAVGLIIAIIIPNSQVETRRINSMNNISYNTLKLNKAECC